jgi:hypothetical protein
MPAQAKAPEDSDIKIIIVIWLANIALNLYTIPH